MGKLASRTAFRAIDLFGTQAMARWPSAITATVWMVWLMYRSYSTCCNIRGAAAVGTFIAGLLVAEAASKLILFDRAGLVSGL